MDPALLARRANRVEPRLGRGDATTADEHRAACATVQAILEFLTEQGWPAAIVADSGNGGHLLCLIDLPNDDASTALVKSVLATLATCFSTESVKVDTTNYNAARIWKCYGTVSRKGDSMKDRPHPRSAIIARPFEPGSSPSNCCTH